MGSLFEMSIPVKTLTILFAAAFMLPVALISFRRLYPFLTSFAKLIASATIAAHIALIMVWFVAQPASAVEEWFWDIDREWNIQSILSSTQFAMISGIALVLAWKNRSEGAWRRLYFVGLALIFLYLGYDEYFGLKTCVLGWKFCIRLMGEALVVATVCVAISSPKRLMKWHSCLILGLIFIAIGGLILDGLPDICDGLFFIDLDRCFIISDAPDEIVEFVGGWLVLLAVLGQLSDAAPSLRPRVRRALVGWFALWILLLCVFSPVRGRVLGVPGQPVSVKFGTRVELHGIRIGENGLPSAIYIYVPADMSKDDVGYSVHLVEQLSGESIAKFDKLANRYTRIEIGGAGHQRVYAQYVNLKVPPHAPTNQALWTVLTVWRADGGEYMPLKVQSSDLPLLDDGQVILKELVLPAETSSATSVPLASFHGGLALEAVAMPQHAQAGETLDITFVWRADETGGTDAIQFLHFVHEASGAWWGIDQQPLGPRLPTRLWYQGLADSETWQVPLPEDLAPGSYTVYTGLYGIYDSERLPATDADAVPWPDNRVALGAVVVEQ